MRTTVTDYTRYRLLNGLAAAWYAIETATDDDDYMRAVARSEDVMRKVGDLSEPERRHVEERMASYREEDDDR